MDEEVKLGKPVVSPLIHDITNGSSPNPKMNKTYTFGEEYKQILKLVICHSSIYLFKFLFLIIIVTGLACYISDTYSTLIISSFTLLGSLLFDQICKKKIPENFDFKRAEKFCLFMTFYVFLLFLLSLFLLCVKDDFFPVLVTSSNTDNINIGEISITNVFWTLSKFKWFIFCLGCSADFSALVEAVVNIPEASLPSRQEKSVLTKENNENPIEN